MQASAVAAVSALNLRFLLDYPGEAARKMEEMRAQRLAAEIAQLRHDYEKRLQEKEEELESIK